VGVFVIAGVSVRRLIGRGTSANARYGQKRRRRREEGTRRIISEEGARRRRSQGMICRKLMFCCEEKNICQAAEGSWGRGDDNMLVIRRNGASVMCKINIFILILVISNNSGNSNNNNNNKHNFPSNSSSLRSTLSLFASRLDVG
jgi:hypothetical protein